MGNLLGVIPTAARRVSLVRLLRVFFAAYLALVLAITLWPSPETTAAPGWTQSVLEVAHSWGIPLTVPVLEASANVVMFLPFGALGVLLVLRRSQATEARGLGRWTAVAITAACGGLLSVLIETTQLFIPGRVSTVQDVVMNASGALLGACAVGLAARRSTTSTCGPVR